MNIRAGIFPCPGKGAAMEKQEMTIEELQEAILEKMRKNGPVTDYMVGTVRENKHQGSLINWVKSFN